ncbi:MAG TPA: GAF domain-containing protein [Terriglobales bacterium]|jgi:GAF domain-containing protein
MASVNPPARLTLAMDLDRVEALSDDLERIAEAHEEAAPLMRALVGHFKAGVPHYHRVSIYLLGGGELRLGPYAAPAAAPSPALPRLRLDQGVCGAVARSGRAEIVADISAEARYLGGAPSSKSELVVPILDGKTVLGVIDIDSDQANAFNEHDQALLERAASLIAGAMLRAPKRPHWEQPEAIH